MQQQTTPAQPSQVSPISASAASPVSPVFPAPQPQKSPVIMFYSFIIFMYYNKLIVILEFLHFSLFLSTIIK